MTVDGGKGDAKIAADLAKECIIDLGRWAETQGLSKAAGSDVSLALAKLAQIETVPVGGRMRPDFLASFPEYGALKRQVKLISCKYAFTDNASAAQHVAVSGGKSKSFVLNSSRKAADGDLGKDGALAMIRDALTRPLTGMRW